MELIVEKNQNHFWGYIEGYGFMPTGQGVTVADLIVNVKESIEDFIEHEGKEDKFWSTIELSELTFDLKYI